MILSKMTFLIMLIRPCVAWRKLLSMPRLLWKRSYHLPLRLSRIPSMPRTSASRQHPTMPRILNLLLLLYRSRLLRVTIPAEHNNNNDNLRSVDEKENNARFYEKLSSKLHPRLYEARRYSMLFIIGQGLRQLHFPDCQRILINDLEKKNLFSS